LTAISGGPSLLNVTVWGMGGFQNVQWQIGALAENTTIAKKWCDIKLVVLLNSAAINAQLELYFNRSAINAQLELYFNRSANQ